VTRAPFQVLVLPFRITEPGEIRYALLRREASTGGYWQGVAGGGEDHEAPLEAARREAYEEAGIDPESGYIALEAMSMIPVVEVAGFLWGDDVLVIPNHCFGVRMRSSEIKLSEEHTEYRWFPYTEARASLHWEGNRIALWELNHRLRRRLGLDTEGNLT